MRVVTKLRTVCWQDPPARQPCSSALTFRRSGCCAQSATGLDIPGDIALVTFDGIEESAFQLAALTFPSNPSRRWRRQRSVRCLSANNAAHDLFPMELIIRQSCGCGKTSGYSA